MPHTITETIRKAPYTKDGSNNNGPWRMYAVELSERMKIRVQGQQEPEVVYTNYRATFFAKESQFQWYDEAFQVGKVVSIQCDTLQIVSRDSNGKTYTTNEMQRPQLVFSQRGESGGSWGQPQQPAGNQQQPRQTPQQNRQQPQPGFDDDIPF